MGNMKHQPSQDGALDTDEVGHPRRGTPLIQGVLGRVSTDMPIH